MEIAIDKSKELKTSVKLVNNRVQFSGNVDGNAPISIDYTPPVGDNLGYTSLELFLLSLSSCVGTAMLVVLRKMQKEIIEFKISSHGLRKQEHPTGFKTINLEVELKSSNITAGDMDKVVKAIEGICPVLSMVKGNVDVNYIYKISV